MSSCFCCQPMQWRPRPYMRCHSLFNSDLDYDHTLRVGLSCKKALWLSLNFGIATFTCSSFLPVFSSLTSSNDAHPPSFVGIFCGVMLDWMSIEWRLLSFMVGTSLGDDGRLLCLSNTRPVWGGDVGGVEFWKEGEEGACLGEGGGVVGTVVFCERKSCKDEFCQWCVFVICPTTRDTSNCGQNVLKCWKISWEKCSFQFFCPGKNSVK